MIYMEANETKGNEMNARQELAEYRAMADFLDEDFDFSEATQKEYNALAAEATAAGFVRETK